MGILRISVQVPKDAVEGGITHDGLPLFVARGKAPDGALCAGKLHPPFVFVLSWGGKEHIVSDYEVLVLPGYTEKHKIDKQSIPKGNNVFSKNIIIKKKCMDPERVNSMRYSDVFIHK